MKPFEGALRALGRPAVLAHRGASRRAPENSLEALRLAQETGADGVEFDVQRCGSGELVVFHDATLGRCTNSPGTITETSLDQLRRLNLDAVASRLGLPVRGARIPTLDEFLAEMPADFLVNLEVKADTVAATELAPDCVDALEKYQLSSRSIVSSFHPAALYRIASRNIARGALVEGTSGWRTRLGAGMLGRALAVHPESTLITPGRVRAWRAGGYRVAVWTVDAPDEIRRVLDAGVDVVITNRPDVARPIAEKYRF